MPCNPTRPQSEASRSEESCNSWTRRNVSDVIVLRLTVGTERAICYTDFDTVNTEEGIETRFQLGEGSTIRTRKLCRLVGKEKRVFKILFDS